MFVYADNAATTRVLPRVLEARLPYFTEQYGNPSSTYPLGQEASRAAPLPPGEKPPAAPASSPVPSNTTPSSTPWRPSRQKDTL